MISFTTHPDVYCNIAKSKADRNTGFELFAQPLLDGTWKAHPEKWIQHFCWYGFWEGTTLSKAIQHRSILLDQITAGERITSAAHAVLPGVFNTLSCAPIAEQRQLFDWLAGCAEPNDAAMLASIVERLLRSEDKAVDDCVPVVHWLLTKGSSELRSGRRAGLAAQILPLVASHLEQYLAAAIRFVLYNESPIGADAWGPQTVELLLDPVERLVKSGSTAIVGDLSAALPKEMFDLYVHHVLRRWKQHPQSRREVIRRLASGDVRLENSEKVWAAVCAGPPEELRLRDADVARASIRGLRWLLWDIPRPTTIQEFDIHPERRSCSRLLAAEFLRATELLSTRAPDDITLLHECAGHHDETTRGIFDALQERVNLSSQPSLESVRAILNDPSNGPLVAAPALDLLRTTRASPATEPRAPDLGDVQLAIEALLRADVQAFAGFKLRDVIGAATQLELRNLPSELKFIVEDTRLVLDRGFLEESFDVFPDRNERNAAGVLYALHEVVHDWQGIAAKETVHRIRFAGAESALMHLDLGADHIAAASAAATFPRWELSWLKDIQARSLAAFPASARNPRFSRIRKALRLVGLRTDLAIRRLGVGADRMTPESYAFADFSPAGGDLVVLVNRPPFAVLKVAPLSLHDAGTLFEGIDGKPEAIARIDEVLSVALSGNDVASD